MLKFNFEIIGYNENRLDQTTNPIVVHKYETQVGNVPQELLSNAFILLEMESIIVTEIILNQNTYDKIKAIDITLPLEKQVIDKQNRLWTADYVIDNALLDDTIKLTGNILQ